MTVLEMTDLADGVYAATPEWEGMVRQPMGALIASAIPVKPPGAWFQNPGFGKLEPLTIQSDGRVTGHIASWREDHIGMNGRVKAPKSRSGYAFFATGVLETAEGNMVNVGQITLTGGHAPLEASVAEAVAHYDNTDSAIMDVAVGEDRHGIWVAGSLRPTVDENQLRAIRASSVSGDWRPINGSLEMVAVCAVNVPGFPIPRARVASGVPVALVAAGTGELVDLMVHQDSGAVTEAATAFDDRLRFVEDVLLGKIGDQRAALTAAIDAARWGSPPPVDVEALRASVHAPERQARLAALRASVHTPITAAALRQRVHGGGGDAVPFSQGPLTAAPSLNPEPPPPDEGGALTADALRSRVHPPEVWDEDGMPMDYDIQDCFVASLRDRVNGGIVATATKSWTAEKRKKAANRGAAMPGGRYPIKDCKDVTKAVHALGRGKGSHAAIKSHIKKRAKALGCMSNLPDDWK